MSWSVAGLPLHILVIHAAVVFGPLAALSALAYVALPRYRDLLRWPTLALVVIAVGAIWAAYLTGQNFFDSDRFANFSGEALENIETHEDYAKTLRWIASGFGIVTSRRPTTSTTARAPPARSWERWSRSARWPRWCGWA